MKYEQNFLKIFREWKIVWNFNKIYKVVAQSLKDSDMKICYLFKFSWNALTRLGRRTYRFSLDTRRTLLIATYLLNVKITANISLK